MTDPRPIHVIAEEIREVWTPRIHPWASPYLDAMRYLNTVDDHFLAESARSVISYFLANAGSFRGEDARRIKAELKGMIK